MSSGVPGIIERAFELANSSANVEQIRTKLRKEGYANVDAHLAGPKIRSDLVKLIKAGIASITDHADGPSAAESE